MALDLSAYLPKRTTIKLGGMVFNFAELTLADLAEFKAYLIEQREQLNKKRRERLVEMAKAIGDVDPMELLKLTDTSISDEEMEVQMETVEGVGRLAYYSLRYAHPGIDAKQAMKVITIDNMEQVIEAMMPKFADELQSKKVARAKEAESTKQQQ